MAKKKEATDKPAEPVKDTPPEGALVKAAKSIGEAAGKVAAAVGVTPPAKPKIAKLAKKNKSRLPRRQKKAAKKAAKAASISR
jgi:hypothetical protein